MAKTTSWLGTTSGAFATAGNWDNGVPVTGDTALVSASAVRGIDGSDQSAVLLAKFFVPEGFEYDVGSSSTPLRIGTSLAEFYGQGSVYWKNEGAATETVYVNSTNQADALVLTAGSAISAMVVGRGAVTIPASQSISVLHITRTNDLSLSARPSVESLGAISNLWMHWGSIIQGGTTLNAYCFGSSKAQFDGVVTNLVAAGAAEIDYRAATGLTVAILKAGTLLDTTKLAISRTLGGITVCPGAEFRRFDNITTCTLIDLARRIGV